MLYCIGIDLELHGQPSHHLRVVDCLCNRISCLRELHSELGGHIGAGRDHPVHLILPDVSHQAKLALQGDHFTF